MNVYIFKYYNILRFLLSTASPDDPSPRAGAGGGAEGGARWGAHYNNIYNNIIYLISTIFNEARAPVCSGGPVRRVTAEATPRRQLPANKHSRSITRPFW